MAQTWGEFGMEWLQGGGSPPFHIPRRTHCRLHQLSSSTEHAASLSLRPFAFPVPPSLRPSASPPLTPPRCPPKVGLFAGIITVFVVVGTFLDVVGQRKKVADPVKRWTSPKGALLRSEARSGEAMKVERERDDNGRVTAYRESKGGTSSTTIR